LELNVTGNTLAIRVVGGVTDDRIYIINCTNWTMFIVFVVVAIYLYFYRGVAPHSHQAKKIL